MREAKKFSPRKLKALRRKNGFTQEKLATMVDLAPASISFFESEDPAVRRKAPSAKTLGKLSLALKCKVDDMFASGNEDAQA